MKDKKPWIIDESNFKLTPYLKDIMKKLKPRNGKTVIVKKCSACGPTTPFPVHAEFLFINGGTDKPLTRDRSNDDFTISDDHEK